MSHNMSNRKPVLERGELAARIIMVKEHFTDLLWKYNENFGNEQEIETFIGMISGNWQGSGVKDVFDTDINVAYEELPNKKDTISGVIALVERRNNCAS